MRTPQWQWQGGLMGGVFECSNSGTSVVFDDDANARAATIVCCCPIYINFMKTWWGKRPMGPNCGMRGVIVWAGGSEVYLRLLCYRPSFSWRIACIIVYGIVLVSPNSPGNHVEEVQISGRPFLKELGRDTNEVLSWRREVHRAISPTGLGFLCMVAKEQSMVNWFQVLVTNLTKTKSIQSPMPKIKHCW